MCNVMGRPLQVGELGETGRKSLLRVCTLYVNYLIMGLSSKHVGCRVHDVNVKNISYADDIVLLSPPVKAFEIFLRVCEQYMISYGWRTM